MRTVYLFLVAVLRVSAWALVGCIDAIRTMLGWFGWMIANSDSDDKIRNEFVTSTSDDAYDSLTSFTTKHRRF
jgi:hypothetical protein